MVNFDLDPNPFEPSYDQWTNGKDEEKPDLGTIRSTPLIGRGDSAKSVFLKVTDCSNPHEQNDRTPVIKKNPFFPCETPSLDGTASTLSMSINSDDQTKESTLKSSDNDCPENIEGRESDHIFYDENEPKVVANETISTFYERSVLQEADFFNNPKIKQRSSSPLASFYDRLAAQDTKSSSLRRTSSAKSLDDEEELMKKPSVSRENSPFHEISATESIFYDRLATQETKSSTLRRASKALSLGDEGRERNVQKLSLPKDSSPFHERLAEHHTFATESRLSLKAPQATDSIPFHNVVRNDTFHGTEVASLSMLPDARPAYRIAKQRESSPLHERLSNHHTMSSIQKQKQLINVRQPSPKPFYTVVAASSGSIGDDISALTKPSTFPSPGRGRIASRNRAVPMPPRPRYSTNRGQSDNRVRQGEANSSQRKKPSIRGQQMRRNAEKKSKQDALYHRLSRQDTVASSRMKPLPLAGKLRSPYEKMKKVEADKLESMRRTTSSKSDALYNRLSARGTKSSIRKQMLAANPRYAAKHDTFSEGCKNALMRDFKGSTFVRV